MASLGDHCGVAKASREDFGSDVGMGRKFWWLETARVF